MVEEGEKRKQDIASLNDALEALRDIWYTVEQEKKKADEILSFANDAIASNLSTIDKAIAYYIRGVIYFKQGRYAEAEIDLKRALNKNETLGDSTRCANAHIFLAWMCEEKKEFSEAIRLCRNGIARLRSFSDSKQCVAEIFCYLAELYIFHQKDVMPSSVNHALICLFHALDVDPPPPVAFYLLGGICETRLRDPQRAIEWYEHCVHMLSNKFFYPSLYYDYEDVKRLAQDRLKQLKTGESN